jgi:hypothetical protein
MTGNVNIDVYFAPNGGSGFYDAISAAVYNTRLYSTISISWGNPESFWYKKKTFLLLFFFFAMFNEKKVTLVGECVRSALSSGCRKGGRFVSFVLAVVAHVVWEGYFGVRCFW